MVHIAKFIFVSIEFYNNSAVHVNIWLNLCWLYLLCWTKEIHYYMFKYMTSFVREHEKYYLREHLVLSLKHKMRTNTMKMLWLQDYNPGKLWFVSWNKKQSIFFQIFSVAVDKEFLLVIFFSSQKCKLHVSDYACFAQQMTACIFLLLLLTLSAFCLICFSIPTFTFCTLRT